MPPIDGSCSCSVRRIARLLAPYLNISMVERLQMLPRELNTHPHFTHNETPLMPNLPLRILVLEDHAFQRSVAVNMLQGLGCEQVLEASDGAQALAVAVAAAGVSDLAGSLLAGASLAGALTASAVAGAAGLLRAPLALTESSELLVLRIMFFPLVSPGLYA